MKTYYDCIPCFLRQAIDASKSLNLNDDTTKIVIDKTLRLSLNLDWKQPPPVVGREIHRLIKKITGNKDPYLKQKIDNTEMALSFLPKIEEKIKNSDDSFLTAIKFSIAGNAIDLGAKTEVDADVEKSFNDALSRDIDKEAVLNLKNDIKGASSVLFLTDNAGEIVFDIPFMETIGKDKLTVAVRGAPAINDATIDDAKRSTITKRFKTITNGSDAPGTLINECSDEFKTAFDSADIIISKGQGNFETLSDDHKKIWFLFLAKCPVVASHIGVKKHTYVVKKI
jgi:uncharacterized protein with ATP-grasp and redox domains